MHVEQRKAVPSAPAAGQADRQRDEQHTQLCGHYREVLLALVAPRRVLSQLCGRLDEQ